MISVNSYTIKEKNNIFTIRQHENGIYMAERVSTLDNTDISATNKRTMNEINKWIKEQEEIKI